MCKVKLTSHKLCNNPTCLSQNGQPWWNCEFRHYNGQPCLNTAQSNWFVYFVIVMITWASCMFGIHTWVEVRRNLLFQETDCYIYGVAVQPYRYCAEEGCVCLEYGQSSCAEHWRQHNFEIDKYDLTTVSQVSSECGNDVYRCCKKKCETCCSTNEDGHKECSQCNCVCLESVEHQTCHITCNVQYEAQVYLGILWTPTSDPPDISNGLDPVSPTEVKHVTKVFDLWKPPLTSYATDAYASSVHEPSTTNDSEKIYEWLYENFPNVPFLDLDGLRTTTTNTTNNGAANTTATAYEEYTAKGCKERNEGGTFQGESLESCRKRCNIDTTCTSFEYFVTGKLAQACQLSTSCTGALATAEVDINLYVKVKTTREEGDITFTKIGEGECRYSPGGSDAYTILGGPLDTSLGGPFDGESLVDCQARCEKATEYKIGWNWDEEIDCTAFAWHPTDGDGRCYLYSGTNSDGKFVGNYDRTHLTDTSNVGYSCYVLDQQKATALYEQIGISGRVEFDLTMATALKNKNPIIRKCFYEPLTEIMGAEHTDFVGEIDHRYDHVSALHLAFEFEQTWTWYLWLLFFLPLCFISSACCYACCRKQEIQVQPLPVSGPGADMVEHGSEHGSERESEIEFCVGQIWSNMEAKEKADKWIASNRPHEGWVFTGEWHSSKGNSYCKFKKMAADRNKSTVEQQSQILRTSSRTGMLGPPLPTESLPQDVQSGSAPVLATVSVVDPNQGGQIPVDVLYKEAAPAEAVPVEAAEEEKEAVVSNFFEVLRIKK